MARHRDAKLSVRQRYRGPKRNGLKKGSNRSGKLVTKPKTSSVVKVVRSILSYLPGQTAIQPLADIIFKGLGYSSAVTVTLSEDGEKNFNAAVNVVGLMSSTLIRSRDLVAFASNSIRAEQNEVYKGASFSTKIDIIHVLNLEVSLRNTSPVGTKTGNWAAWLKLIKHDKQSGDPHPYTYKDLSEMSFATVATAREDIVLRVPKFHPHWKCGRELLLEDVIAILYIGFEDLNREKYADFSASDFSCSGTISSNFVVLAEHPGNYAKTGNYKMEDQFADYDYLVYGNQVKYKVKSTKTQEYDNKEFISGKIKDESSEEETRMVVI